VLGLLLVLGHQQHLVQLHCLLLLMASPLLLACLLAPDTRQAWQGT
jgi:hypothetical protein